MDAIRIHQTGGPEVLSWEKVALRPPGPGELGVTVAAAGVNFIDTYHRRGIYPLDVPFTPGLEGAGVVSAIGDGVTEFAVGDRVAWASVIGAYAEEVVLPADRTVSVPDGVSLEIAAAAMLQGMTVHYLASSTFPLVPGHRCLIHAGAGGVGRVLIQVAKLRGAEVFTTVSTAAKADLAASAGADHVILYSEKDFVAEVEAVAGANALDVVYDGVGAATFDGGLRLLKPRGTMVLFGQSSGAVAPFDLGRLATMGSLFITRPTLFSYVAQRSDLLMRAAELFEWIESGAVEIMVGDRWPMSEAADAHRALEARATVGKVLLVP